MQEHCLTLSGRRGLWRTT